MAPSVLKRAAARGSARLPGLRQIPLLKLLAIAEVLLMVRGHVAKLEPHERRRLAELVRLGRGRKRNLTARQQTELADLLEKAEARQLLGTAVHKLSPVPIPRRLLEGRRSRR
jgi:hypothetical protein